MGFRIQLRSRNTIRVIGLVFLILASVGRWILQPAGAFGPGFVDGTTGLLYGISIGCLLLSLRRTEC